MNVATWQARVATVGEQGRRERARWWLGYAAVVCLAMCAVALAWRRPWQIYFGLGYGVLVLLALAWAIRPRLALNAVVLLALVGDQFTVEWFPFTRNLSNFESILYLSGAAFISPLELLLITGLVVLLIRRWFAPHQHRIGPLLRPLLVFTAFVGFGFFWGMYRGGDLRVAMYEMRALLYIPLVYVLVTAYCTRPVHHRWLMWCAIVGISIQSVLSLEYARGLPSGVLDELERLTEHGASVGVNMVFVFVLAAFAYRHVSGVQRLVLALLLVPTVWVYLLAQRRAAVIGLVLGLVLLAVTLFWNRRRMFWTAVPLAAVVMAGYVGAFWTSESSVAFPAQAIRGVIAPDMRDETDESSDLYRYIENINLHATIRADPVRGIGFGQPFYRPLPLPDISSFEFHEYFPHNSFLWIWLKTGFAGFVTLIYLLGRTLQSGVERLRRQREGPDAVVTVTALLFVVMYTVFTYVDIAWDARNNVILGMAMAICAPLAAVRSSTTDGAVDAESRQRPVPAPV